MSVADPNRTILTGENPFIRLSSKDGDPNSTDASYWRILFCPAGPGHVLYVKSELTHGHWRIYSDNIAMARWLQQTVQGMLNADLKDTTIGLASALSLLPYVPIMARTQSWNGLLKQAAGLLAMGQDFSEVVGLPGSYLAFAFAGEPWQFWIVLAVYGTASSLFEGPESALVAELVPGGARGRAYEDNVIDILVENLDRLWRGEKTLRNQVL